MRYITNKEHGKIRKLEAYFAAAEHYEEIIKGIVEIEDTREFERIMEEKFGTRKWKYLTMMILSGKDKKFLRLVRNILYASKKNSKGRFRYAIYCF